MNEDQYISWVWHEFAYFRNHRCRQYLIDHYRPLAMDGARQMWRTTSKQHFGALVRGCMDALIKDIGRYKPDREISFEDFYQRRIQIRTRLSFLTRAEKHILLLYYHKEMSIKEIGEVLGLPETRISQIYSSIIKRLKS